MLKRDGDSNRSLSCTLQVGKFVVPAPGTGDAFFGPHFFASACTIRASGGQREVFVREEEEFSGNDLLRSSHSYLCHAPLAVPGQHSALGGAMRGLRTTQRKADARLCSPGGHEAGADAVKFRSGFLEDSDSKIH